MRVFDLEVFDHDPRLEELKDLVPTSLEEKDVRPEVMAIINDPDTLYTEVHLGDVNAWDKEAYEKSWDDPDGDPTACFSIMDVLWQFATSLSDGLYQTHPRVQPGEQDHFWNGIYPQFQKLTKEQQALGATMAATTNTVFFGNWSSGGGQVDIERDSLNEEEAVAVEALLRMAEAAGLPSRFVKQ